MLGTRYYDVGKIMGLGNDDMPTIGYARVSSHDQNNDLVRQQELLEAFCAAKGWRNEVIADLGSGLNYKKKGLNRLLELSSRYHNRKQRSASTSASPRWQPCRPAKPSKARRHTGQP